jgi:ribosomal protein S18 acetylase RimI-like enzyme
MGAGHGVVVSLGPVSAPPSSQESLLTALEFERGTLTLVVDEVRAIEQGWLVRSPALSQVWLFNNLRIDTDITYEEAVELCRRHLPEADFDQLFVLRDEVGDRLAGAFRDQGWQVDVDVHSVLRRDPDRLVPTDAVVDAGEEEALDLMERWLKEDETLNLTELALAQLREGNRLTWRARGATRLGVRDHLGRLTAITLLFSDGQVAQVEDVYVIPEARGQGHARALVTRAIELALEGGHEVTFIVADDNDWPKQLYRKLGFEPVGRTWLFHRERR